MNDRAQRPLSSRRFLQRVQQCRPRCGENNRTTNRVPSQPAQTEPDDHTASRIDRAKAILSAALKVDVRESKTKAALHWVPWLAAYSGARSGELAQLRRQDVEEIDGVWLLKITPEAGTVKTNEVRLVPLHSHLIELGFSTFVQQSADGPLFLRRYTPGTLQALKNRLAEFARGIVKDPNVAPVHGWRHRWKSIAIDAGVPQRVADAIQGHAPRSVPSRPKGLWTRRPAVPESQGRAGRRLRIPCSVSRLRALGERQSSS